MDERMEGRTVLPLIREYGGRAVSETAGEITSRDVLYIAQCPGSTCKRPFPFSEAVIVVTLRHADRETAWSLDAGVDWDDTVLGSVLVVWVVNTAIRKREAASDAVILTAAEMLSFVGRFRQLSSVPMPREKFWKLFFCSD